MAAVFIDGAAGLIPLAVGWGISVTTFTVYRLVAHGYLLLAGLLATVTGLHNRIGSGLNSDMEDDQ